MAPSALFLRHPLSQQVSNMVSVVADPLGEGTVEALLPQQIMMQVAWVSPAPQGGGWGGCSWPPPLEVQSALASGPGDLEELRSPCPHLPSGFTFPATWQSCALHLPMPWDLLTSHLEKGEGELLGHSSPREE